MLPDNPAAQRPRLVDAGRQKGLVARAVEHRARVVAHPAVDRDVRADLGDLLHGADAVQGERGGPGDGAAGLHGDARRRRQPGDGARVGQASANGVRIVGDVDDRIGPEVAGAEPASDAELGDLDAVVMELSGERDKFGDGTDVRVEPFDLRADVAMQSHKLERRASSDAHGGGARDVAGQGEAELGILGTGLDELVGVRLDAGRDPHEHRRPPVGLHAPASNAFEPVELVEAVDDDASDARIETGRELVVGLVVSVEDDARRGEARVHRDVELTASRDVEAQSFLCNEMGYGRAQERFAGVGDVAGTEVVHVLATPPPELVLVVDEQRRTELLRQRLEIRREQLPRYQAAVERVAVHGTSRWASRSSSSCSIASGAWTPRMPSASARPMRQASHSHRRAWVSASSSEMTRQSR